MSYPHDYYTPYGYLANPYHRAHSWSDPVGGLLRTADDVIGLGWVEPTSRDVAYVAEITLAIRWNGRLYQTRSDFARLGYWSAHHSSRLFSFDWDCDQLHASLAFALADDSSLAAELSLKNRGSLPQRIDVVLACRAWAKGARWTSSNRDAEWTLVTNRSRRTLRFTVSGPPTGDAPSRHTIGARLMASQVPAFTTEGRLAVGIQVSAVIAPEESTVVGCALARDGDLASGAATRASDVIAAKQRDDDAFYAGAARPVGDWPDEWKRGWVYDLETTRSCVFPPGGIFHDIWPSWMMSWPRTVLAEGTLDAARLSYAAPDLALRLIKTILRDAPAANVPCVFEGGEPNMVAKDGSICGTSPAWCLPFHNVRLLFLRTLDRAWLSEIYPHLVAYLDYWLRERTDDEGWVVYKCTWEAGEDCTPRLDPSGAGDEVVSRFVRPVELQATLCHSAGILAGFAREVGDVAGEQRWSAVADDFARRTQQLWDADAGRFRDWDKRVHGFLPSGGGQEYWDTDPLRYSALSFTPVVAGIATTEQLIRLRAEVAFYDAPPWCLWPSWSYVVAEAATAAGWHDFTRTLAYRIVSRVYRQNDRRSLANAPRPTPGTAPEFWPLDLADFTGSDGYGWGATTTSLWVRQIFGFLEAENTSAMSFVLVPNLPDEWLIPGRCFGFANVPYRGVHLELGYEVTERGMVAMVRADQPSVLHVEGSDRTDALIEVDQDGRGGRFSVELGRSYRVTLDPST